MDPYIERSDSEHFLCSKLFSTGFANRSFVTVIYIIMFILSQGVNLMSIDKLTKILTFNAALLYAEDKSSRPDARSAFLTYLVSTLVDKSNEECGTDLENIWFIYVS